MGQMLNPADGGVMITKGRGVPLNILSTRRREMDEEDDKNDHVTIRGK